MNDSPAGQDTWLWDADVIGDAGERVSHLRQDHVYFGHLSLYHFAASYCPGARVLDAGSGAGYGTAHLADAGAAETLGIDASERAVAFARYHFSRPNLTFETMGVESVYALLPRRFDLIFTSNTLEHVADALAFVRGAWHLIDPQGTLVVAVPPITDDRLLYLNLINPYHVNLWSPRQWSFVLGQFFEEVCPHLHGVEEIGMDLGPELKAPLSADTFVIAPGTIEEMYQKFTLTTILVARGPRPESALPALGAPMRFVDDSFTRLPGVISAPVRQRLAPYFPADVGPVPEAGSPGAAAPRQHPETLVERLWARVKGGLGLPS
ncbi:MAG TPA: methyltransferase domain-containing protein [Anaerolineae bacterium]|nr:methyltransferase domain-containing protein [Anaerolineae bacterium]